MNVSKKIILLFLILTFLFSSIFYYLIAFYKMDGLTLFLMWCPGLAAVTASKTCYKSLNNLGLGRLDIRHNIIGIMAPVLYFGLSFTVYWLLLGGFHPSANQYFKTPILLLLSIPMGIFTSLGEELGWRGLLLPELTRLTGFKKAALLSGLIWAVWHFPIILSGSYLHGVPLWFLLPVFIIIVTAVGTIMAVLRLSSDSVWPAVLLHASHNFISQGILEPSTTGPYSRYLVGENGLLSTIAVIICTIAIWKYISIRRCQEAAGKFPFS